MREQPYEIVIGLEVHVQLRTRTKLFCRCSTEFGQPANTQTCPVCTGQPGSLPVMNRDAFQLSMKTALALHCQIPEFTRWDRKQYYYPDLPKGYQISQYDLPMSCDGWLEICDSEGVFDPKRVGIIRAHLEEDAGKSMHDETSGRADSRIDLNRTGTPLLEIVSQPDLRSAAEARAYLDELKLLLQYLGVSDCNMQEGSLRVDANVNLHLDEPGGVIATPIVEIKNLNSFRAVERALEYESQRQYEVWLEKGVKKGDIPKQTRGWDDQLEVTRAQRHKEESSDYRYFPDPDLVPVVVNPDEVERVRATVGELPAALRLRLQEEYEVSEYDANVIVNQGRDFVGYFVEVADASGDARRTSNWIQQEILRRLNELQMSIRQFPVTAAALAGLVKAIASGELDSSRGRDVFGRMFEHGESAAEAMQSLGIVSVDAGSLRSLCEGLLAENPRVVAEVKEGKQKAVGALIGQAKRLNPNVNPSEVRAICLELIAQQ